MKNSLQAVLRRHPGLTAHVDAKSYRDAVLDVVADRLLDDLWPGNPGAPVRRPRGNPGEGGEEAGRRCGGRWGWGG